MSATPVSPALPWTPPPLPPCLPADSYCPSAFLLLTSAADWTGARQQSGGRVERAARRCMIYSIAEERSCNLFIATPRAATLSAFKQQLPRVEIRRVVECVGQLAVSLKSGLHQVLVSLKMAFCKNQQQPCDQCKVSQRAEKGSSPSTHPLKHTEARGGTCAAPTAQKSFVLAH